MKMLSTLVAVIALSFGTSGCGFTDFFTRVGNDIDTAAVADVDNLAAHVQSFTGSVSVDPLTGMITVSGDVGFKDMEKATKRSNEIIKRNAAKGIVYPVDMQAGRDLDPCGTRRIAETVAVPQYKAAKPRVQRYATVTVKTQQTVLKNVSLWRGFLCFFGHCPKRIHYEQSMPVAEFAPGVVYAGQPAAVPSAPPAAPATAPAVGADGSFSIPAAKAEIVPIEERIALLEKALAQINAKLDRLQPANKN